MSSTGGDAPPPLTGPRAQQGQQKTKAYQSPGPCDAPPSLKRNVYTGCRINICLRRVSSHRNKRPLKSTSSGGDAD